MDSDEKVNDGEESLARGGRGGVTGGLEVGGWTVDGRHGSGALCAVVCCAVQPRKWDGRRGVGRTAALGDETAARGRETAALGR